MGIAVLGVVAVLSLGSVPPAPVTPIQPDARNAARRIAATVHLAAQEYRLAWDGGRLTNPE